MSFFSGIRGDCAWERLEKERVNHGKTFPFENVSMDICLMATVLHDFVEDKIDQEVLQETARVVKPNGILAMLFKRLDDL